MCPSLFYFVSVYRKLRKMQINLAERRRENGQITPKLHTDCFQNGGARR